MYSMWDGTFNYCVCVFGSSEFLTIIEYIFYVKLKSCIILKVYKETFIGFDFKKFQTEKNSTINNLKKKSVENFKIHFQKNLFFRSNR